MQINDPTVMHEIGDIDALEKVKASGASLIMFGGEHCSVCQSVRPRLSDTLKKHFTRLQLFYVDCEQSPGICAQYGVFSLPVIQVYIEGMMVAEAGRAFGLNALIERIERPYMLWLDLNNDTST